MFVCGERIAKGQAESIKATRTTDATRERYSWLERVYQEEAAELRGVTVAKCMRRWGPEKGSEASVLGEAMSESHLRPQDSMCTRTLHTPGVILCDGWCSVMAGAKQMS